MIGISIFIAYILCGLMLTGFASEAAKGPGKKINITQRDMAVWTILWPFVLYVLFFRPKEA